MDPITVSAIVVAGGILIIDYLKGRVIQCPIDITPLLEKNYKPEQCDLEMLKRCRDLLENEFPYPQELCMWTRIEGIMAGLSYEDRKALIEELYAKAADEMKLNPAPALNFEDIPFYGLFYSEEDRVCLSSSMLKDDKACVEMVKTIFHELKHTVQWRAIQEGGNVWGYSDDLLSQWALNHMNYVSPYDDPEGYIMQGMEMDSFGFETCLIQNPEHMVNFQLGLSSNDTGEAIKVD